MKKASSYTTYYEAIRYLEGLNNVSGSYQKTHLHAHPHPEMYLERMQDLLDRIGNPEKLFKYVHITGTSGKGSVSTLVHTTLVHNNKKAGLFTSPFVTSTIEKIQVGKKYIDPKVFAEIIEYLKPHIDYLHQYGRHGSPSYFEIVLATALIYFKQTQCEYVVLEVGLGGRYDATNVIQHPLITAITNIGLDHTQVLGSTTEKIAHDKAGIIKKGSVFFTTETDKKLLSIFKRECAKVDALYSPCDTQGLDYSQKNTLLAHKICTHLGMHHNVRITNTLHIPARFEIITHKPLIIIDGAHNPSKIESTIYNLHTHTYKKLIVVIAISADKDWRSMLDILLSTVDILYVTRFSVSGRTCVDPRELALYAQKYIPKKHIHLHMDPRQSFTAARDTLTPHDALLVTGSFYLAGDIRGLYCPEEQILKQRTSAL